MQSCVQLIYSFLLLYSLLVNIVKSDGSDGQSSEERAQNFVRHRRQLLDDEAILADPERHQLELNQSVPFIFSARLYPFGVKNGDSEIVGDVGEWTLPRPMLFLENAYDTIWVHRNGLISMAPNFDTSPKPFPLQTPLIAAVWTEKSVLSQRRRVLIREINDGGTLALAQSEVNIQFRYGSDFAPEAIILITWIEADEGEEEPEEADVLFQLALILGKNACFAHLIFSKMPSSATNAISGFNGANSANGTEDDATNKSPKYFMLPGSGASSSDESQQLSEKSNIGIPGEWLMRIDEEQIHLCGAGFQGIECVDSCLPTQWYLDCSRTCHCAEGSSCNIETGECPDGKCNPGWKGSPICDEDIDECTDESISCPDEQPDCMNTPGAYLCFCFEYDNSTGTCIGSSSSAEDNKESVRKSSDRFAVPVASMALVPKLVSQFPKANKISPKNRQNLPESVTRPVAPKLLLKLPIAKKPINSQPDNSLHRHHSASAAIPPLQHSAGSQSAETCTGCDPHAQCVQEKCQCAIGWSGNGKQCFDIDECALNATICGVKAECQNIDGSYQCICNAGFIATQNGDGCIDVDECEESVSTTRFSPSSPQPDICPQPNSVCKNAIGGFVCECRSGYMGNPAAQEGCADVDECALAEYYCGNFANCTNLSGSFRCDCHDGYEKMPNSNHCQDIDECKFKNACHKAATCTNLEGGFRCECVEGFVGGGLECHETILFPSKRKSPTISHGTTTTTNNLIHLDTPLKLFGQIYSNIYISRNGIIAFDHPINDSAPMDDVVRSHNAAILPLYSKYDKNGSLEIQQFDENSHNAKGPFSRSSLIVQQQFHIPDFRPKWILVVTWREMTDVITMKKDKSNTFQAVLVDGINGTFAIFLYENVQILDEKQYFAAILHPSDGLTSEIPPELLVSRSNVGQPGKWIFRIDESRIRTCPSGTQDPPFCQQDCDPGTFGLDCMGKCHCANGLPCDFASGLCPAGKCAAGFNGRNCDEDIDECDRGTHRCHATANCTNLIGSYSCTCQLQFYGDGFNCSKMNACLLRSNMKCADNAHCDESNAEMPECICNDGFHGDGRRNCEPFVPTTTSTSTSTPVPTTSTLGHTTIPVTDEQTSRRLATKTTSTDRSTISLAENHDDLVGATNESKLLMVIVCTVIGAVWLVVVGLFALIYCIKRYRRIHHHEYSPQMLNWIQTRTTTRTRNINNNGARSIGGTYQLSTTKYF